MGQIQNGAFRLFRFAGIDVFLHWSWLVVALYSIQSRERPPLWNAAEYVSLFVIVLLHEFGHAFACRSVGGQANRIMLWPLGGIAFVSPPPRPGAVLWSIAAGPLVNVALLPILWGASFAFGKFDGHGLPSDDLSAYLFYMAVINTGLLLFNLLPIYPLDGGQIVQSLLWFAIGRAKSLIIAGWIGIVLAGVAVIPAFLSGNWLLGAVAVFVVLQAWSGVRQGKLLKQVDALPRRTGVHCPNCHEAAPLGDFWLCQSCQQPYDIFARHGLCPHCGHQAKQAPCLFCGRVGALGAPREQAAAAQVWEA